MKTFGSGLQAHYSQDSVTLARVWRITLTDGSVYRLAKHSADIVIGAETFLSAHVVSDTVIEMTNGFEADVMKITVLLDGVVFAEADIHSGRWSNAVVEVLECNYADTTQGVNSLRRGRLGQWTMTKTAVVFEARPLHSLLGQSVGRQYLGSCDLNLGDAVCGINLATFTDGIITNVTVGSSASRAVFTSASLTQAAGWFTGGLVTFKSGANLSTPRWEIKAHATGGVITLQLPVPNAIAPGDLFDIQVGCDKSWATCQSKFSNSINFQGFPFIPGMDRLQSGS